MAKIGQGISRRCVAPYVRNPRTHRRATWILTVLLWSLPLEAATQAEPEILEFGSVWVWSDPSTFEEAVAIEISTSDGETAAIETKLYVESPRSNRAELITKYNPETAGFGMVFRDSISGWKAEVEGGFIFEEESLLPLPQERWSELIPVFSDPEVEGIAFLRVRLSNGIEITAEHATYSKIPSDQTEVTLLRERLKVWMDELSPDELQQGWDFPESTLELLQFLEIPHAEPLRKRVALLDALIGASLYAHRELEARQAALSGDSSRQEETDRDLRYQERDWKVTEGRLGSEAADRVGARGTVEMIKKEITSHE